MKPTLLERFVASLAVIIMLPLCMVCSIISGVIGIIVLPILIMTNIVDISKVRERGIRRARN